MSRASRTSYEPQSPGFGPPGAARPYSSTPTPVWSRRPGSSEQTRSSSIPAPTRTTRTAALRWEPWPPLPERGAGLGLAIHAGHGLTVANVGQVAALPLVEELNIGHAIVAQAVYTGIGAAVREMRAAMDAARPRG